MARLILIIATLTPVIIWVALSAPKIVKVTQALSTLTAGGM